MQVAYYISDTYKLMLLIYLISVTLMFAINTMLSVTCYPVLAICYLLSVLAICYLLVIAIKLFPFAQAVRLVIFQILVGETWSDGRLDFPISLATVR